MTEQEVRDKLPAVTVRLLDGRVLPGVVGGRQNKFAGVAVQGVLGGKEWMHVGEWTWTAITNAVNSGTPLVM